MKSGYKLIIGEIIMGPIQIMMGSEILLIISPALQILKIYAALKRADVWTVRIPDTLARGP